MFTPLLLHQQTKWSLSPCNRRLAGSHIKSGRFEGKGLFPLPAIESRIIGILAHNTVIISTALSKRISVYPNIIQSYHCHAQNVTIPCRLQELLSFLSVIYNFLLLFSAIYSSILPRFILPSIYWSTSWSCWLQINIQYSYANSIFFHSLYMSKLM
jgi:hypothetical protein